MKKATQYARASTDMQGQSVPDQLKATSAFAKQHDYQIVGEPFIDDGKSGVLTKYRPAFLKLMNLIQSGHAEFNCILVYDVSRWGRFLDEDEGIYWEVVCRNAGVEVIYTNDNFPPERSVANTIMKTLQRIYASNQPRKLSKDVIRGLRSFVEKGSWPGAPPYAYARAEFDANGKFVKKLEKGESKAFREHDIKLVPGDKTEVKTVRQIFDWSKSEVGEISIVNRLNTAKIPSPSGGKWGTSSLQKILTNEVYTGKFVWGRMKGGKFTLLENSCGDTNPSRRMHDKDKWIVIPNAYEPIVDRETFDQVQKNLKKHSFIQNPGAGRTLGSQFLLTGIVRCGSCGGKYSGRTYHRRRRKKAYLCYRCATRAKKGDAVCKSRIVNREQIDHFVLEKIKGYVNRPEFWNMVEKSLREAQGKDDLTKIAQQSLRKEIENSEKGIETLLDLIEKGDASNRKLYDGRLSKKREELEKLQADLAQLEAKTTPKPPVEDMIRKAKKEFSNLSVLLTDSVFGDVDANELKKKLIKRFLWKVIVDSNRAQVDFYFYKLPRITPDLEPLAPERSKTLSASRTRGRM